MEGPIDPQHPGQDAGASQPEAQDGDLHALLVRLLGQGDVRPSAPGAGDDLWPDVFAAAPAADEVSTIVPPPDAPTAVADLPAAADQPARAWEPVLIDSSSTTTNVDDIHAAILASVSVDLEPIVPAAASVNTPAPVVVEPAAIAPEPEPAAERELDIDLSHDVAADLELPAAMDFDLWQAATDAAPEMDALTIDLPSVDLVADEPVALEHGLDELSLAAFGLVTGTPVVETVDTAALDVTEHFDAEPVVDADPIVEAVAVAEPAPVAPVAEDAASFVLTPFEATEPEATEPEMSAEVSAEPHHDADALWAAAVPELGLDVAPLLDLDVVDDDVEEDAPVVATAVVLPWPSQEPKTAEPAAPSAHDLIEAALSGLHADLTSEPVEPLRTPDVAVSTAHVVFRLGTRTMAVPLAAVSEIARPPKVTRLPHVPAWVLGIANLRGDIVSMLDLEGFFSGKYGKSSHEQRMLALRPAGDEVRTAVLVDSVDGIQAFEDARIARVTRGYDAEVAPYARGLYQLEDDLVVVVDADRLLQSKPMRQFEDGAGAR
jgi:chemotaxis signal transduction protein